MQNLAGEIQWDPPRRKSQFSERWGMRIAVAVLAVSTAFYAAWEVSARRKEEHRSQTIDKKLERRAAHLELRLDTIEAAVLERGERGERIEANQHKMIAGQRQILAAIARLKRRP